SATPSTTRPPREISPDLKIKLEQRNADIKSQLNWMKMDEMLRGRLSVEQRFGTLARVSVQLDPEPLKNESGEIMKDTKGNSIPKADGRFNDVSCPEATSVRVGNEVLHANYVRLENRDFICTQAPMPQTIALFYKGVLQNTNFIVDLTNIG